MHKSVGADFGKNPEKDRRIKKDIHQCLNKLKLTSIIVFSTFVHPLKSPKFVYITNLVSKLQIDVQSFAILFLPAVHGGQTLKQLRVLGMFFKFTLYGVYDGVATIQMGGPVL